ncbi:hypothetical protein ACSFC1_02070 [Pseudothermotoga sp. U03pept]|uniref:hypothetical protein n=1 Tax=Pseudothermotoga sp. U03pept TaxID=3447012 RepID=UPI003EFD595F
MHKVLFLLTVAVIFSLSACLSLLEPNIGDLSEKLVKDLNDYLQGQITSETFIERFVHIGVPATITDARFFGSKFLSFFDENASEVSLVSYGDSGLKSYLENPPRWVEKVYVLSLLLKTDEKVLTHSCPMLLIEGKPYLMTVYASGTQIVSYPVLEER